MIERGLVFALARVTIELKSPLTLGGGRGDDLHDAVCVTDANGVPALPGTSLAGVLRAAVAARSPEDARRWFGFQKSKEGASSRVEVSWGLAHGGDDRPVEGRLVHGGAKQDPVLGFLSAGVVRDHVRIGARGVADDRGKFDARLVPVGARFTFELLVHASNVEDATKVRETLVAHLRSGAVRLGGKTRSGFGQFEVVRAFGAAFDLRKPEDRALFAKVPRSLSDPAPGLSELGATVVAPASSEVVELTLELEPEDFWIFGTGRPVRREHESGDGKKRKAHDRVPVTERRITWASGRGVVTADDTAEVLVPASGVKGALRHRAAFHARRLKRDWALEGDHGGGRVSGLAVADYRKWAEVVASGKGDAFQSPLDSDEADSEGAIADVFGTIKGPAGQEGRRGRLVIDDIRLSPELARSRPLQHVSLDRFTQGPMDGLLFSEAPIARGPALSLRLRVDLHRVDPDVKRALGMALDDLARGRLPIGGGSNRGHGYFRATDASLAALAKHFPGRS